MLISEGKEFQIFAVKNLMEFWLRLVRKYQVEIRKKWRIAERVTLANSCLRIALI